MVGAVDLHRRRGAARGEALDGLEREAAVRRGLADLDAQPAAQVRVCTNLPCSLRGARDLLHRIEAHLGIHAGESTPDGRIRLGHEDCLGACAYAPMMRVDREYHEDLDVERAKRILDALD